MLEEQYPKSQFFDFEIKLTLPARNEEEAVDKMHRLLGFLNIPYEIKKVVVFDNDERRRKRRRK